MQKLNSLIEKKYQNSFLNNKEVFKILKKKIYLINKIQNSLEVKKMKYNRNNFHVNNYFLYLIDKKKLTQKEMDNILSFYKKFSVQLNLKKIYDSKFKKKTDLSTNVGSFIYLGNLILKLKKINFYQKLNVLIKINDISVCKYKYLNNNEKFFLKQNLKREFELLKKCI